MMLLAVSVSMLAGCGCSRRVSDAAGGASSAGLPEPQPTPVAMPVKGGVRPAKMVAKVHIYKTNGDYDNNVPVTLDASRTGVVAFPAPSDLSAASTPVKLADGYLLDRRGVGANTAFTRYTYPEYEAMAQPPTTDELLRAVIPDARVTEVVEMPFSVGTGDEVNKCNELISAGLPGCKRIYP